MKALDLTGKRFGKLVAKEVTKIDNKRGWVCTCDCGNEISYPTFQLTGGNATSCGCGRSKVQPGQRYGKLEVVERVLSKERPYWVCKCDCGEVKTIASRYLTGGNSTDCGCGESERRSKAARKEEGVSLRNKVISNYRHNAKTKGLEFTLSDEEMIEMFSSNCHYCNIPPSKVMTLPRHYGSFTYNGIDRLYSDKGYVQGNVKPCCSECNYMKNDTPYDEFINRIKAIYEHRRG